MQMPLLLLTHCCSDDNMQVDFYTNYCGPCKVSAYNSGVVADSDLATRVGFSVLFLRALRCMPIAQLCAWVPAAPQYNSIPTSKPLFCSEALVQPSCCRDHLIDQLYSPTAGDAARALQATR